MRSSRIAFVSCLLLMGAGVGTSAGAQKGLDTSAIRLIQSEYLLDLTSVHERLAALAAATPADKYGWRPSPDVRTVSQVLMHVAGEWEYLCPMSIGTTPAVAPAALGPTMRQMEAITTKADVARELERTWAGCRQAISGADVTHLVGQYEPIKMTFARATIRIVGDQHEHLGQMITYARALGIVPPWSK